MRNKTQDSNIVTLENGAQIMGTYMAAHGGLSVTLFLLSHDGLILGHRNYAFARTLDEAPDTLYCLVGALKQLCDGSKFEQITEPRIQNVAAKALLRVLTKAAVFKAAA